MNSSKPHILVTGGAGFIGAHTCCALADSGFIPVVVDDLSGGFAEFVQWGPLIVGDCGNSELLRTVCRDYAPVACIHFAGLIEVGRSMAIPDQFYQVNVGASISLFKTLQECGVRNVIFSSTAAVYQSQDQPLQETDPIRPASPYGKSKWMVEEVLADMDRAYDLPHVCLRYFNAAGGHPTATIGEAHSPETHLIPSLLDFVLGKRPDFTVFGDGTCIRDYIHVMDLADAHVRAIQHLINGGKSLTLNVGTGRGHSVNEVVKVVETIVGHPIHPTYAAPRAGDSAHLVANVDAIFAHWGWRASRDLRDIIEDAWRYRRTST
jgi:UDP-glucose 4-epimerase